MCSENKGADLRLCFRICKKPVFSRHGSNDNASFSNQITYLLTLIFDSVTEHSNASIIL